MRLCLQADHWDAARVLSAAQQGLLDCLPAEAAEVTAWSPLLLLADTYKKQLPQLYAKVLSLAARATVWSLDTSSNKALPLQQFLASKESMALSIETYRALLASATAGARSVEWQNGGGSDRSRFAHWQGG